MPHRYDNDEPKTIQREDYYKYSLDYHRYPTPGKLSVTPSKPLVHQQDLALAYTPGVAAASKLIAEDPSQAAELTIRSNLVAVISNGTAVLGLGDIGPLASKPVMEGKAVLFKKFAGIDVFDIEIDEKDPDKLVDIIASLEPTFGGINLEDIKAPECFYIEEKLSERMQIPVFHDDQHGTAIIVGAAILNALKLVEKNIGDVRLVVSGAGAAAIACLDILVHLGLKKENIIVCDAKGVVNQSRQDVSSESSKGRYRAQTQHQTLKDAMVGADIFLGVSCAKVVDQDMVKSMGEKPVILALSNPEPEIMPELIKEVRPEAIIATGRTDFPNQVNNVLCFPYIFRGALDVGATKINLEMKLACVHALAELAMAETVDEVSQAYGGTIYQFGPEYIIPKPFDPRLMIYLPMAVAKAAMETGVATRPIENFETYRYKLMSLVYRSETLMRPVFTAAKENPARIAFAEGEEETILKAAKTLVQEGIGHPILIGRPEIIERRINHLQINLVPHKDFDIIDPNKDARFNTYWKTYYQMMNRQGVSPDIAKATLRTNTSVIAALAVHLGDADTMICGTVGRFADHLKAIGPILGARSDCNGVMATMGVLWSDLGPLFICDTYVNDEPTAEELVEITLLAAEQVKTLGITPKVGIISHSNFGSRPCASASKMQTVYELVKKRDPSLMIEGEMTAGCALSSEARKRFMPDSTFMGRANLLICPNIESANVAYHMAHVFGKAQSMGPVLLGTDKPGHIVTPSATVRDIVNMAAFSVVDATIRPNELRLVS